MYKLFRDHVLYIYKENRANRKITDEKFQRIFGVKSNTFFVMLDKLDQQLIESHKSGGRPPSFVYLLSLLSQLSYLSTTYEIIKLVKKTLCSCEEFKLHDKQKLK